MAKEKKEKKAKKAKSTFGADFKKFITKGNVIDMAVGVVIGGAFGKITTGLVNYIINPCVSLLTGGIDLQNLKYILVPAVEAKDAVLDESGAVVEEAVKAVSEVAIQYGAWIQTIIDFLIISFCIFVVLRIIMKAKNLLEAKKIAEEKAKAEEAAAKAEADKKAAAEAAAKIAERQKLLEESVLNQEKLLQEICTAINARK